MKPQDTSVSKERSDDAPERKVYEKPELQVYGDLAEITQAVGGSKSADGAGHPNKHFTA
jgi:hypothetical protein